MTEPPEIEGQLDAQERALITKVIREAPLKPQIALEIGTWLGGGSTLHILRALQANGAGHLWGIEADPRIYERMLSNIKAAVPDAAQRFTPMFGFSTAVIPKWLNELPSDAEIDVVFLDGGGNPIEQVQEFKLLSSRVRVGGVLMAHDARTRKGKWLVPYISLLDNWKVEIFDFSFAGLLHACKLAPQPSATSRQLAGNRLRRMRLEPKEVVARLLPRQVNGLILSMLPPALQRKLTIEA